MREHLIPAAPPSRFGSGSSDDPRLGDVTTAAEADLPTTARVAIIGVPCDAGVARNGGRAGAAGGPDAFRRAFYPLTPFNIESGGIIPARAIFDLGDIRGDGDLESIHARLSDVVEEVCRQDVVPLIIGGGHDLMAAAASGAARVSGPLSALTFDPHLDVRSAGNGAHSGSSVRLGIERGDLAEVVEFGTQSFVVAADHVRWLLEKGGRVITLAELRSRGSMKTLTTVWQTLSSSGRRIYCSLDLDVARGADAPGVSAPTPDGLSVEDLLAIANTIGRRTSTIAFDISELNPRFDVDDRTARLAAHIAARFVAGVCERPTTT